MYIKLRQFINRTIFYIGALFMVTLVIAGYALITGKTRQKTRNISRENLLVAWNISQRIEDFVYQSRKQLESIEKSGRESYGLEAKDPFETLFIVNFGQDRAEPVSAVSGIPWDYLEAFRYSMLEDRLDCHLFRDGGESAFVIGVPVLDSDPGEESYLLGIIKVKHFARLAERLNRLRGEGEWSLVARSGELLAASQAFSESNHEALRNTLVKSVDGRERIPFMRILTSGKDLEGGVFRGDEVKWIMASTPVAGTKIAINVFQPESMAHEGLNFYILKLALAFLIILCVLLTIGRYEFNRTREPIRKIVNLASDILTDKTKPLPDQQIETLEEVFDRIADKIQESRYHRIKSNIQLLNLNELNKILLSSVDLRQMLDTISHYIIKEFGFTFIFLGLMDKENRKVIGEILSHDGKTASDIQVSLEDRSSAVIRTFLEGRTIRSQEPGLKGLLGVKSPQRDDFPLSNFISLPIVAQKGGYVCWERKRCVRTDCDRYGNRDMKCWEVKDRQGEEDQRLSMLHPRMDNCYFCELYPILGVVALNFSPGNEQEISNRLLFIKTIVNQIGILVENALLVQNLQKSEKFREDVLNSMSSGLIMVDMDGKIIDVNPAAEKILGRQKANILGEDMEEIVTLSGTDSNPILKTLREGEPLAGYETKIKSAREEIFTVSISTSFLSDQHGDVYGVIGELIDTSDIRQMEVELKNLEKLAAMGRLTTSIAHEIRNPLAGIGAGIQYLEVNLNDGNPHRQTISFIKREIDRLDRIIVDLYTISRPSEYEFRTENIMDIVSQIAMTVEAEMADRKIRLICREESQDLPFPYIDPDKIKQVLLNLLKNAIQASSENNEVEILIAGYFGKDGDVKGEKPIGVKISVMDHGVGIDPQDVEKIYEPFFSRKQGGTGLGLYICYSIIERHRGAIHVASEPGKGTTVTINLPDEDHFKEIA